MFKNLFSKPIEAAKEKVSDYVNLKIDEVKLTAIEKASPIAASLILVGIILTITMLIFVFLGMALASWLITLFESAGIGYLITAGIFILMLVILALSFKGIVKFIATKIGKGLSENL